jgi:2,3,4,5-tetrahydropyridine-2-carboxylate N-succinyltransferase
MTYAMAVGVGTKNARGEWLEVFFPEPKLQPSPEEFELLGKAVGYTGGNQAIDLSPEVTARFFPGTKRPGVAVLLETDAALTSVPEVYLKLHLLSYRLRKPNEQNLTGIFKVLPNVAWTNRGAIDLADLPKLQLDARLKGETLDVQSVDKFPKMTDYVVPSGVRIADPRRVRLGAYLGPGTTVMHEGFINYNAGTAGPNMVEGRISAGVFCGEGTDLGGGCSTMGTLSGGGDVVITIGKNCLIGANAGVGIALGDGCTIEAGLYVTAASKVRQIDRHGKLISNSVKARDLSGKSHLLFRRNSTDGAIECLPTKQAIALNHDLHANN